jgi:nucleotidyltransferase AbiEii toxin of type IV toxin-antitoxin system
MLSPRLDILPTAQRTVWYELAQVPSYFTLYGGTGIALRLGHRQSVDFDFFAARDIDPDTLLATIPALRGATIVQKEPNTLTVIVDRAAPVQLSFFGVPRLGQILEPEIAADSAVRIASLLDLAGTKVALVQKRAEARDYVDIDAILASGLVGLPAAVAAAKAIYGPQFNPQISLKALVYFEDGTLVQLQSSLRERLVAATKSIDLDKLPTLQPYRPRPE